MKTVGAIFSAIKWALIVVVVVTLIPVVGDLAGLSFFNKLNIFGKHELEIEKTENVVTEIKKISEFTTACYIEERPLIGRKYKTRERAVYKQNQYVNRVQSLLGIDKKQDGAIIDSTEIARIVYKAKGTVRAGYDLSKIESNNIKVSNDTLFVNLPDPEIFDVIINPSDITQFDCIGAWSESETTEVIAKAAKEIENDAIQSGLIEKAETSGKEKFISLFKTFGFANVVIE